MQMTKLLKITIEREDDQYATTLESEDNIMVSESVSAIHAMCRSIFRQCTSKEEFAEAFDHIGNSVTSAHEQELMRFRTISKGSKIKA
jgi:hypothetical protein